MELAPSATGPAVAPDRLKTVAGTYNLRDTGGYEAGANRTRWGKLFRSDALHRLTDDSRGVLAALGIRLVIDLRDHSELLSAPSRLEGTGIDVVHTPIYTSTPDFSALGEATLAGLYRLMIADYGHNLAAAVGLIARSGSQPVLVHCTAGKDRTGLVVALALLAAGVERRAVVDDYAATESNLRGEWAQAMLSRMTESGYPMGPQIEQIVTASPPEVLEDVLDAIEAEHGSIGNYLLANGLTPDDLDLLRSALVEPTTTTKGSAS
jgi:protein-tyrosine phosphatase